MSDRDIPEDLLFIDVLTRLPVKSLARFRCVSKSWCARINSKQFIKHHYTNRRKLSDFDESDVKIVVGGPHEGNAFGGCPLLDDTFRLYSCDFHSQIVDDDPHGFCFEEAKNLKELKLHLDCLKVPYPGYHSEILGSCNGLVCIGLLSSTSPRCLIFYNPLTRKHWILAPISLCDFEHVEPTCAYGFGHDIVSDDIKLVVLVEWSHTIHHKVIVYSQKLDSWRVVTDSPFQALTISDQRNGVFACNALHWIMRDREANTSFIAAFDLSTEQFHQVPNPEYGDANKNNMQVSIGNLGGCLSVLYHIELEPCAVVDLWVMKDYGDKNSWTKLTWKLPIGGPDMFVIPLGCLKEYGQQVLFQINKKFLMQYDFELKLHKFITLPPLMYSVVACVCYGSLLQLQRFNTSGRKSGRYLVIP